jgi:hypothetical protein
MGTVMHKAQHFWAVLQVGAQHIFAGGFRGNGTLQVLQGIVQIILGTRFPGIVAAGYPDATTTERTATAILIGLFNNKHICGAHLVATQSGCQCAIAGTYHHYID